MRSDVHCPCPSMPVRATGAGLFPFARSLDLLVLNADGNRQTFLAVMESRIGLSKSCIWRVTMTRPVRRRKITLNWKRFEITRKTLDEVDDFWRWCVYVIADPTGKPLYIGRATGRKYRGFGERYVGNSGPLSAIAHGSPNRLYLGRIEGGSSRDWYTRLEKDLIAMEARNTGRRHPRYNVHFKSAIPGDIPLKHTGDVPRFYHLQRGHSRTQTRRQ